jgi:DNA modification methylase
MREGRSVIELHLGDCLEVMGEIADGSIDLVLADLPYGKTRCCWDSIIPFEPLWAHYRRLLKPRGAVVLTASQPFTSILVMSNPEWYRETLVWEKTRPNGVANANRYHLKAHEDIVIFSPRLPTYNPQMADAKSRVESQQKVKGHPSSGYQTDRLRSFDNGGAAYPRSVIRFANPNHANVHPTQKPVPLFEYLIRTYSNEGDTVLDNVMGSGTTGLACLNTGRNFIGIEKHEPYFRIAQQRLAPFHLIA